MGGFYDEGRRPLSKVGLYGLVTFLIALIALGSWVGAKDAGRRAAHVAQDVIERQAALGCERSQVQRVYDRIDETYNIALERHVRVPVQPRIASPYFRMVNCGATYTPSNTGVPIYLNRNDERCFIRLVASHYFLRRAPTTDPNVLRGICGR